MAIADTALVTGTDAYPVASVPAAPAGADLAEVTRRAHRIRQHVVAMCAGPEGGHLGGSMSLADVLAVLYFAVLRNDPDDPSAVDRDVLLLSKGHAAPALYACLAERGYFSTDELVSFGHPGTRLMAHPVRAVPGVEMPTGSLGHGLSLGVGFALAARDDGRARRVFCLLGDGELQEGAVWEAAMAAGALGLDNLVAIVDRNGLQITGRTESAIRLEPLAARWSAFGWNVVAVDGHDVAALAGALGAIPALRGRPTVLLARTVKGRGIDFIEGKTRSHFARLGPGQQARAMEALARAAGR